MHKFIWRLATGSLFSGLLASSCAWASGVSPYLPVNLSAEIERQIERVLILADHPVMTRPIAAATVLDALPTACAIDELLCRRVRRYLNRYIEPLGLGHAGVEAAITTDADITLPNSRGMSSDSTWQLSAQGYWQPNAYAMLSLGAVAYEGEKYASGTMLSLGFEFAQLDIGYREHWLSPFTQSSLLMGTQAKTLPSITLSNYAPLTALGLHYEFFVAEMGYSNNIRYGSSVTAGNPRLGGLHLSMQPAAGWAISSTRLLQYGGGARGGGSLQDLWRAFTDPAEYDANGNISRDAQFGNQQASWTSRFLFPGPVPFSAYLEYGGEDRAYEGNFRLGDAALSIGLTFPRLGKRFDLTYEISELQGGWYVHSLYLDGITTDGHVLGHWAADARVFRNGVGTQAHLLRIGWEPEFGGLLQVRARMLDNEQFTRQGRAPVDYQRAYDITASYSRAVGGFTLGIEALAGRNVFGDSFARLAAFARLGNEWAKGGASWPIEARRPEGAELFIDSGLNANRVLVTLDAVSATDSGVRTDTEIAPHIAIGARRAVSTRNDLGVRAEFDRIDDRLFVAVRALDYRYRFATPLALTAFLGAARYDLATPAFGLYGGLGAQWRDILPRFDLGLDLRYADKVTRRKTLPNDPPRVFRPDSFYDISSVSLYLSYRW